MTCTKCKQGIVTRIVQLESLQELYISWCSKCRVKIETPSSCERSGFSMEHPLADTGNFPSHFLLRK